MTRAMWMAAAAPVVLLAALYFVFDYELANLVGGFLRKFGR